ncbi:IS200/IS605 family transposase [Pedobacter endophyticus]|uniref:IS200/IS605 family transposase n=1 Tax=Pedobacter endophyticus TaxID=2789740 RepID=A0A7U3SQJ3_9SPHI|nr:IS200/IS605 family transposase [Pedobacter endophyticus]QPH38426.1 IS200/IS605 family transposase [Pedobacter endophyticus]
MSYVRIWVHIVFSTKNRHPYLTKNIRYQIQNHIAKNCKEKSILLKDINGYTEHLHCLISLGKEQTIAQVVQLIKGESAHWINNNNLISDTFMWQDDYFAVSVSESNLETVSNYIKNQENHHRKKTFDEEVKEFIDKYKFELQKD